MIRAAIVDDEKHCSESLILLLKRYVPEVTVIAEINDPLVALEQLPEESPDLVFLDIEMPRLNGFELIKQLPNLDFEIIFTTAYNDFAIRAFRVSAIDYLLKPIEREELIAAIGKFNKHRSEKDFGERFRIFMGRYAADGKRSLSKVALPTQVGFEFIDQSQIIRCESESNYTKLVLADGNAVTVSRTLKEVEAMLDEVAFVRVHHSHLIHLDHIRRYHKGSGGSITMDNGDSVAVSRSKKAEFLNRF